MDMLQQRDAGAGVGGSLGLKTRQPAAAVRQLDGRGDEKQGPLAAADHGAAGQVRPLMRHLHMLTI